MKAHQARKRMHARIEEEEEAGVLTAERGAKQRPDDCRLSGPSMRTVSRPAG